MKSRFAFHFCYDGLRKKTKYSTQLEGISVGKARGSFIRLGSLHVHDLHAFFQRRDNKSFITLLGPGWIQGEQQEPGEYEIKSGDTFIFGAALTQPTIMFSDREENLPAKISPLEFQINFEEHAPGCLVGVWKNDKPLFFGKYGVSNIMTGEEMNENMHFRIGSLTKTFTSTLLLQLVEEGLIKLEDEACTWMSEIPAGIQMIHLANMTSGLFNYSEDEDFLRDLDKDPQRIWKPTELVEIGLKNDPYFEPGKGWYYSNTNYIIIGLIIERIRGDSLENQYRRRIWEPLGTKPEEWPRGPRVHTDTENTSFGYDLPRPHPRGYMYGYHESTKKQDVFRDVTTDNPSWTWAAGGIISTIHDLKAFIKPFVLGSFFSQLQKSNILIRTYVKTRLCPYGVGNFDIGGYFGHNGNIPGFQCTMFYNPKKDHTVVVMTNLSQRKSGATPADTLTRDIIEALENVD